MSERAVPESRLGAQKEIAWDDGTSAGKRSIAGAGHAVKFKAQGKNIDLVGVRIFCSRYGQPSPPNEDAYVWLCDSDFKRLATFPVPYSTFTRGEPKWITIPLKRTRVPDQFVLCVGFNPTSTKGVYVHYDAAAGGQSFTGLPGSASRAFDKGDWLIRAVVQEGGD
jgi:RNA polymerase sigma-70 factor (ECF subfamily)